MQPILDALIPLVDVFEELGIPYYLGGSLASTAHGIPRTTLDVDLIADVQAGHVPHLVQRLQSQYYIHSPELLDAIVQRSAFNLIHLASLIKLDVFLAPDRAFDRSKAQRVHALALSPAHPRQFWVTSPEDIILQKLEWYLHGGAGLGTAVARYTGGC